jgi:hypothetical protein
VGAPVEGHVLEEVRQALLVIGLVDRSGIHRETQIDTVGGAGVPPDVDGEAVVEHDAADRRVERQRRCEIDCRSRGGESWRLGRRWRRGRRRWCRSLRARQERAKGTEKDDERCKSLPRT